MRLIDADSLKKHWDVDPNAMFKPASIINTIEREPTAAVVRAAPQWIKTSDALPPDYCYVVFCAREEPIPRFGFFDKTMVSFNWGEDVSRKPVFFALGCYDIAGTLKQFNVDEVECWLPVENPPTGYFTPKAYLGYRDDEMEKN